MRVAGFNHVKDLSNPRYSALLHHDQNQEIDVQSFIELMELDISITKKRSKSLKKSSGVNTSKKKIAKDSSDTAAQADQIKQLFSNCLNPNEVKNVLELNYIEGKRHNLVFEASKLLLQFELTEYQILEIVTNIAILKNDEELGDRLKVVTDVVTFYETRKGLLEHEENFRLWTTIATSKIKKASNAEMSKESLKRVITFFYQNQLANGVCGAISVRKVAEHTGLTKRNAHNSDYLIPIELEHTQEDLQRQQQKINAFNKERNVFKSEQDALKSYKCDDIDTVSIGFNDDLPPPEMVSIFEPNGTDSIENTSNVHILVPEQPEPSIPDFQTGIYNASIKNLPNPKLSEGEKKAQLHQKYPKSKEKKLVLEDKEPKPEKLPELKTEDEQKAAYAGNTVDDLEKIMARIRREKGVS